MKITLTNMIKARKDYHNVSVKSKVINIAKKYSFKKDVTIGYFITSYLSSLIKVLKRELNNEIT